MFEYKTIDGSSQCEWEISKSRFITYLAHIENEQQAQEFITSIKKKHFDARHNCSAYIIGQRSEIQKASDDGEPSGTAGAPMLEVLKKNELSDLVVVVTRYFGGIKLGAGGLIRAYGKSVSLGLENASIVKRTIFHPYHLELDYNLLGTLENYLHQNNLRTQNKEYSDIVSLDLLLEKNQIDSTLKDILNLSAGRCKMTELDPVYLNIKV